MAKVNKSEDKKGKKPAHEIYPDLLIKQKDNELTETFIAMKRGLFAQLPPPEFLERQQIDMIYSSLHEKIKEKVPRDSIATFDELLKAAKRAEEALKPKKRIRCNFCRHAGHTAEVCRKKANAASSDGEDSDSGFALRSTVRFQIDDITDVGIVGTAAASCVASKGLYNKLKARGYQFTPCHDLVNGTAMNFLRVTCNVKFGHRTIPTTFVIFPEDKYSENMLGRPFLRHVAVDFGCDKWYFPDNPTKIYPLLKEKPRRDSEGRRILRIGLLQFG